MFYGKKVKNRESALLHLLKRITDEKLTDNLLEDELREVIVNRDNIEQDNFDDLIKTAKIIDLEGSQTFETLLEKAAKTIPAGIDMNEEEIIARFLHRQEQSNTAVSDFLAIPHIIIDGEDKIFLTIIRCKDGVKFTNEEDQVKAIFLLGGTKDKRVLHLKTIASIATLVQHKDFQENWERSESTVELKNLMILNSRKRFF